MPRLILMDWCSHIWASDSPHAKTHHDGLVQPHLGHAPRWHSRQEGAAASVWCISAQCSSLPFEFQVIA
ncbi:hypothetical protein O3P69_006646 [Scylla paramamosain]|uniref:Uncharacterized protein n=1 Tax=Scylla paramamosain TaxID=85552 RepID=A0AAW0U0A5_SCYPA